LYYVQEQQLREILRTKQIADNLLQALLPKFIIDHLKSCQGTFLSIPAPGGQATVLVAGNYNSCF
jgi:hypothetical protein